MPVWLYPAITAGVSALSALLDDGGGSSGVQTSTQSPASPGSTYGGGDVWDQAISLVTGDTPASGGWDYWRKKQIALATDLQKNDPIRWGQLSDVDKNIRNSQAKFNAYSKYQEDGDQQKLLSALAGIAPHEEIVDVINGRVPIADAITRNRDGMNHYAQQKEQLFPELSGMYSDTHGQAGAASQPKPILEQLQEDYDFKKDASGQYLNDMGTADEALLGSIGDTTDQYTDKLGGLEDTLNTPAFYLNLGGKNVGVNTRGTRQNVELLADLAQGGYNADVNRANTGYTVGSNAATRGLTQAETYTPNGAFLDYFQKTLMPLASHLNDLRYGLPSTTETGSLSGSTSFLERLGNTSQIVSPIVNALQNSFGGNQNNNLDVSGLNRALQQKYPGLSIDTSNLG